MNVADLHRQLTERGFKGSYGSVYAFVTKRLGAAGKKRERLNAANSAGPEAAVAQGSSPSSGPDDQRNASLLNKRGSTPSAPGASSWPRRWTWRTGSPI